MSSTAAGTMQLRFYDDCILLFDFVIVGMVMGDVQSLMQLLRV